MLTRLLAAGGGGECERSERTGIRISFFWTLYFPPRNFRGLAWPHSCFQKKKLFERKPMRALSEKKRLDLLKKEIDLIYRPQPFAPMSDFQFERIIQDMFEVLRTMKARVEMIKLLKDDPSIKAVIDSRVLVLLRRRDAFLMTLGFRNGAWQVIEMSHPYLSHETECFPG
jgi:hypothetical protein